VIAVGVGHQDGVELFAGELVEIRQRLAFAEPHAAVDEQGRVGDLDERAGGADLTGAAEEAEADRRTCRHRGGTIARRAARRNAAALMRTTRHPLATPDLFE
jgi:hypothetical protein